VPDDLGPSDDIEENIEENIEDDLENEFEDDFGAAPLDIDANNATIDAMFDFVDVAEAKAREQTRQELGIELHEGERLQKVLARSGVGSRRHCEELIAAGRVRVNGQRAELGRRVDAEIDAITIDGAPIGTKQGLVYYLLNKPEGVVTTADDPEGRETVLDFVPEEPRVYPVGRLDIGTEGLLLLTNDGELAYRVTHPSFGVEKEYLAQVQGNPNPAAMRALREGVVLDDGLTAPAKASLMAPDLVKLVIHEGRNRQVRRMLEAIGHPVVRLARTRIATITDSRLPPGRWRPLERDEIASLSKTVRTTRAARRASEFGPAVDEPSGQAGQLGHMTNDDYIDS
jgi:23S rRNA pseudouridine2605 synthase